MTALPTEPVACANPPRNDKGKPIKRTHRPVVHLGLCETAIGHARCVGYYTHPCGCVVPCACTQAGHEYPHPYEPEDPDVLPDPFTVPTEPGLDGPDGWRTAGEQDTSDQGPKDATPQVSPGEQDEDPSAWGDAKPRPWREGTGLDPISLADTVAAFAMGAGDLHRTTDGPEDYDPTDALTLLTVLRAATRVAGELDSLLVRHIYRHGQRGEQLVDGIGRVFVRRKDVRVKWDQRGTAFAVVDQHMERLGGETPDPRDVVEWLLEAAAVGYYRVTALRALDLDPENYRHREKGDPAVDVPIPK